jgi:hypothetical protein
LVRIERGGGEVVGIDEVAAFGILGPSIANSGWMGNIRVPDFELFSNDG